MGYRTLGNSWSPFGDGSDGDLTVTGTVILTAEKQYRNLTVNLGGLLQMGADNFVQWPALRVSGILRLVGTIVSGFNIPSWAGMSPASRKTAAGQGNSPKGGDELSIATAWGGRGGGGGGDGTNMGGPAGTTLNTNAGFGAVGAHFDILNSSTGLGTTGASAQIGSGMAFSWMTCPNLPGGYGRGGGSGALLVAGNGNYGGAGGTGGRGRNPLVIIANSVIIDPTGLIHVDGENGYTGEDGAAVNAIGDISGGGGGGGGGSGATVLIAYHTLVNNGTVRSLGGAGGNGGLGAYKANSIWAPGMAVAVNQLIRPTAGYESAGRRIRCTIGGVTGSTEPHWSGYGSGNPFNDGTAQWVVQWSNGGPGGAGANGLVVYSRI